MTDPYAQQRAVAASIQADIDRNERASILEKLDLILALLQAQAPKAKVKE